MSVHAWFAAEGAKALYAFGDSFVTNGNGGYMGLPYGMTWPGYPAGRASDGRNVVDYLGIISLVQLIMQIRWKE